MDVNACMRTEHTDGVDRLKAYASIYIYYLYIIKERKRNIKKIWILVK